MLRNDQLRREGNLDAIMSGFISKNPLSTFQAICGSVNHNVYNESIKKQLNELTGDPDIILGYSISQLAIAALHKFENVKYEGEDIIIQRLIEAPKWFDK